MNFRLTAKDVRFILFILMILLFTFAKSFAVTKTSVASGTWTTASTWSPSGAPANTDDIIISDGHTITFSANTTCRSLTFSDGSVSSTLSATGTTARTLTVTNAITFLGASGAGVVKAITCASNINITCGSIVMPNTTGGAITRISSTGGTITVSGSINLSGDVDGENNITSTTTTPSISLGGDFISPITVNIGSFRLYLTGTANQSICSFTQASGSRFYNSKSGGTATMTGDFTCGQYRLNTAGGTLDLGVGLNHTILGSLTNTAGTLNCNSSTLNLSSTYSGTGGTINTNTSTFNYNGTAQTILPITYNNLTLSNSGAKTFPTGTTTVNGTLRLEGTATATVTGTLTYGSNASIVYKKTTHTTGAEWPTPFNGSGGVTIQSGTVTFGANESLGTDDPLIINSLATLNTGSNFTLTLGGNFTNSGTFIANASDIIIANTAATQIIDGFTTTGNISMTKTSGVASFNRNVSAGSFTLNGLGGTLNFGNGNIHTFSGSFTITNGTLNLGSSIINIAGAVTYSGGTLNINTSTLNYNSASAQDILPVDYYNLNLSDAGTKTITSATSVSNELDINAGTLVTGGFLTLKSTATGTARVGTNAGTITGDIIVERFIPGGSNKRKWRFLSSPVNVSGSIAISQYIDDILITAPAGTAGGFDVNPFSPTNTASFRTYDETVGGVSNNGWTDPTDVTNTIASGIGAEVFVRGTRTLTNPYLNWTTPDDVTIDFVGALNSGTISPTITYTPSVGGASASDGFNLVGNPYASTIDFTNNGLTKTNIDNKFWCYNPNTGSYGIYDMDLNDSTNSITRYIASGQAFFIRANATNPVLSFTEAIKCAAPGNNYFKGNQSKATHSVMHITVSNDSTYADEALVVLDETASCYSGDTHDAGKLFNDALNIYTLSDDNVNLTINALPFIKNIDTIKLALFSYNGSNIMTTEHRMSFSGVENFDPNKHIYLQDNYTNTITNLAQNNSYTFNITSDNTSWGKNRFSLLFSTNALGISSTKSNAKIELYPNPASSEINLKFSSENNNDVFKYQIIDIYGRIVSEGISEMQNQQAKINIETISSGQYFINIISDTNTNILRFVK